METISSPKELDQILGVFDPFKVSSSKLDLASRTITVTIENTEDGKAGLFRSRKPLYDMKSWSHKNVGRFAIQIEAELSPATKTRISKTPPPFLGAYDESYTAKVKQLVLFGLKSKLETHQIATLCELDEDIVKAVKAAHFNFDHKGTGALPPPTDQLWLKIIKGQVKITTKHMGLNMLLTKARMAYTDNASNTNIHELNCEQIYTFFTDNEKILHSEFAQLGIKSSQQTKTKKNKSLNASHPIWDLILKNKVDIASRHVGFNFNLMKLKNEYSNADSPKKTLLIKQFMMFIKTNLNQLGPERLIIAEMVKQVESNQLAIKVPEIANPVWNDILNGKFNLNSKLIPLNLLITQLKSHQKEDSDIELRNFITNNAVRLDSEINAILEQANKYEIGKKQHA